MAKNAMLPECGTQSVEAFIFGLTNLAEGISLAPPSEYRRANLNQCVPSNCVYAALPVCHGVAVLRTVFAVTTSLRATAIMMSLCGLPLSFMRFARGLSNGL